MNTSVHFLLAIYDVVYTVITVKNLYHCKVRLLSGMQFIIANETSNSDSSISLCGVK